MDTISFKRHRFPPDIIRHAVSLRQTPSSRDVEDQRGLERAYGAGSSSLVRRLPETCFTRDPFPTAIGILMSIVYSVIGYRAVDNEGEVLDFL